MKTSSFGLNRFELRLTLAPTHLDETTSNPGAPALAVQTDVRIDGHALCPIVLPAAGATIVDLADVRLSSEFPSTYEFLTCSCGQAGCAGFQGPITVGHEQDVVLWDFPASYAPWLMQQGLTASPAHPVSFRFDRQEYRHAIEQAMSTIIAWEGYVNLPLNVPPHAYKPGITFVQQVEDWRKNFQNWQSQGNTLGFYLGDVVKQQQLDLLVQEALHGWSQR